MRRCLNCGFENWESESACASCGKPLAPESAPAAVRTSHARSLANRAVATAERAIGRIELRAPDEAELKVELARRARRFFAASSSEIAVIVARYAAPEASARAVDPPWWRRRPKITVGGVVTVLALVLLGSILVLAPDAGWLLITLVVLAWWAYLGLSYLKAGLSRLSDWWRSLPTFGVGTGRSYEYRARTSRCDISDCREWATAEVDLERHTGDRELRSKHLCSAHAEALQRVLGGPVQAAAHADGETIALLRSAESDLEEAATLDPELAGVEENLAQVKLALVRVGETPRQWRRPAAASAAPARETRRAEAVPEPPRSSPRRAQRKKPRRR